jgi:hypothetical protein
MAGPWEQYAAPEAGPWTQYAPPPEPPVASDAFNGTPEQLYAVQRNTLKGAGRGLTSIQDAGTQLLGRALVSVAPEGSELEKWAKGQLGGVEGRAQRREQKYQAEKGPGSEVGRIAGGVAGTAPLAFMMPGAAATGLLPSMASGAATGATVGALTPVENPEQGFWTEKLKQLGIGGVTGGLASGATNLAARAIAPKASQNPDVQMLLNKGVTPTPGQMLGGTAKSIEEKAISVPLLGESIKGAHKRGIEQFNRAAIDDALAPISAKLPKDMAPGRDAIAYAQKAISDNYDNLLPKLSATVDRQFEAEFTNLTALARAGLTADEFSKVDKVLAYQFQKHMSPNQTFSGEALKTIESDLGSKASNYMNSTTAAEREIGGALKEAQAIFRRMIERSNPGHADALKAANAAAAKMMRIDTAAGRVGAEDGVFTPAQLLNAVRSMDPSVRNRAFARGDAIGQPLAEAGKKVLSNRVPNSGTADRAMLAMMASNPLHWPYLAGAGVGGGAYSQPGQKALATLLASRGQGAPATAALIRELGPAAASMGPLFGPGILDNAP